MKSLYMCLLVSLAFVLSGCGNSELVSCQEQNELLNTKLTQAQGKLDKATKALEACKRESGEVQTKAMEAISTMMTKQQSADDKVKGKLAAAEGKVAKLTKQLEGHKVLAGVLEGKMKEMKDANSELSAKVEELEAKLAEGEKHDEGEGDGN